MSHNIIKRLGQIDADLSTKEIAELAHMDASSVREADRYDTLHIYIELKRYEYYLKALIAELKKDALQVALNKEKKTFQHAQARVHVIKRRKWDYSVDLEWSTIRDGLSQLTDDRKSREAFLREHNGEVWVDEETGEVRGGQQIPVEVSEGLIIKLGI